MCVVLVAAAFRGGMSPVSSAGSLLRGGVHLSGSKLLGGVSPSRSRLRGGVHLSSSRVCLKEVGGSRSALVGGGRLAEAGIGSAWVALCPTDAVKNAWPMRGVGDRGV